MKTRKESWTGMNWIRQEKRLAIYLRDGMACCYCGRGVEDGVKLTLDHVKPHSKKGTNAATNLVTACSFCNSSRGNRPVEAFISAVAAYINHGATGEEISKHVRNCQPRALPMDEAKALIQRRGSAAKVIMNRIAEES